MPVDSDGSGHNRGVIFLCLRADSVCIPRRTAILTTVAIGCALLMLGAFLVTAAATQIAESKDDYEKQFRQLLVKTRGMLPPDWYTDPNNPSVDTSEPLIRIA